MLTKEELLSAAEVMKAAAEGKPIQSCWVMGADWVDSYNPQWEWNYATYRVKPEICMYRLALCWSGNAPHNMILVAHTLKQAEAIASAPTFKRWITDWLEVEV